jgi:hypothetical protein
VQRQKFSDSQNERCTDAEHVSTTYDARALPPSCVRLVRFGTVSAKVRNRPRRE